MLRILFTFLFSMILPLQLLWAQEIKLNTLVDESIFPIQDQHAHGSSI
jgi:hypothetical protein